MSYYPSLVKILKFINAFSFTLFNIRQGNTVVVFTYKLIIDFIYLDASISIDLAPTKVSHRDRNVKGK